MRYKFSKTVVIALGGSIMYPEAIDISFLKKFRKFILKKLHNGSRFIIVTGGGRIARIYQEAADKVVKISDEDKDWLGIHSTRVNAHLLRTIFREVADPVIIDSHNKMKKLRYPVTIASGWRPGWSTDYISIAIAEHFKVKEAVIAGKPSYVYPVRGRAPQGARSTRLLARAASNGVHDNQLDKQHPYKEISWKEYRKLIPAKWKPGLHSPVDPVGAKLAEKKKIAAIIINGKDLKNFEQMLSGRKFNGSIIS
ncbi:MAG: hypothetical protein Q7K44_04595 [Candidatus Liptonbacteria bacterium]|nr:hypothetical protein [Candidatus Liptonbacteria bacterium]